TSSGSASRPVDDPVLVRELLALPRMHLIVDGYNVTRAEWDDVTLEAQRNRLLRGLAPLVAQTGAEITVVFDGTNAETRPLVRPPRGVRVLFSPRGVLADDVIRDLVDAEPAGRPVGVVTSDQEVARDVVGKAGVRVVGSRALVRLLG
ncbi:MAG TPA: NYN domain-containing protein, partial [Marmoricola sp.]